MHLMLCLLAIDSIFSISQGFPKIWVANIAHVLLVICSSIRFGSILYVSGSISTNTGVRLFQIRACTVAENVKLGTITSPLRPSALNAIKSPEVALDNDSAKFAPIYSWHFLSNSLLYLEKLETNPVL